MLTCELNSRAVRKTVMPEVCAFMFRKQEKFLYQTSKRQLVTVGLLVS